MKEFQETGSYHVPTEQDRYRLLSGYYRQILNANPPDGVGKMKQFACWFTHGVGNGSELRRIVHTARTLAEIVENVERFFERKAANGGSPAHEPDERKNGAAEVRT
jgi:tRNA-dihydrouridine synthase